MFKVKAAIHSLGGNLDEVTIVEKKDGNHFIAEYRGSLYTAIFNPFTCLYYVDDKYGFIRKVSRRSI